MTQCHLAPLISSTRAAIYLIFLSQLRLPSAPHMLYSCGCYEYQFNKVKS